MSAAPKRLESSLCVTLLVHTADLSALSALRCGDWPGYLFCAAATEEELQATLASLPVRVAILCGPPRDENLGKLLVRLRELAPELALLWVGADAREALPVPARVLPSLEPNAELFQAIDAACRQTTARQAHDPISILTAFSNEVVSLHARDRIAGLLLDSALALLRNGDRREMLTGAVLATGEETHLTVQAALASFPAETNTPAPSSLLESLNQVIELQRTIQTDNRWCIPLSWYGRVNSILVLEDAALPAEVPDSLRLLVNQAAAALESSMLFELAAVDTTTRAYTRTFAIQRLYESLKSAYRTGMDLTVLMLDLDKFKLVNDTYGHLVGDRVLRAAGQLLRDALRESDVLGRYGGDEFLAILPNTPIAGGVQVARRLLRAIGGYKLEINNVPLALQISIGIGGIRAEGQPDNTSVRPGHDFFQRVMERLIAQADGVMYRAKHAGDTHYAAALPMTWGSLLAGEGLIAIDE